jgi:hypothetical protein
MAQDEWQVFDRRHLAAGSMALLHQSNLATEVAQLTLIAS